MQIIPTPYKDFPAIWKQENNSPTIYSYGESMMVALRPMGAALQPKELPRSEVGSIFVFTRCFDSLLLL